MHSNPVEFTKDFFFTDIMNHVEFLKWTNQLEKDDDILLIGILERLATESPTAQIVPFYGSIAEHRPIFKNPLNIAKAYGGIQALSGHEYNIYEFAYVAPGLYRYRAWLSFVTQVSFFGTLFVFNLLDSNVRITPDEDGFKLIVLIMVVSTALFLMSVRNQFLECQYFVDTMRKLRTASDPNKRRAAFLWINQAINQGLGGLVLGFNIYFILVSDSPTDAVLNSVALAFIVEIDDAFKPNWTEDRLQEALATMLRSYITEPLDEGGLNVKRSGPMDTFADGHNYYVRVGDLDQRGEFVVSVFSSNKQTDARVTISYGETNYYVSGNLARELHAALSRFNCLENLDDMLL